jgi:hypothetical protein
MTKVHVVIVGGLVDPVEDVGDVLDRVTPTRSLWTKRTRRRRWGNAPPSPSSVIGSISVPSRVARAPAGRLAVAATRRRWPLYDVTRRRAGRPWVCVLSFGKIGMFGGPTA